MALTPALRRSLVAVTSSWALVVVGCPGPETPPPRRDAGRDAYESATDDAFVVVGEDARVLPDAFLVETDAFVPGADAGPDDLAETDPFTGPVEGLLLGVVSHADTHAPLTGVHITLSPAAHDATSDVAGTYSLPIAPGEYVAHYSADGFLSVHRRVHVDGWERVIVNVSLLPARPGVMVDGTMGGTVDSDGTRVTVLGTSLVDSSGMPVEMAEIAVTPIDPVDDLDGAPGDFVGESADGSEDPLVSYGMVDIEISTSTGPGDFADGTTATVEFPVGMLPPGDPPLVEGECMPLWWFDPERAIWVEQGEACAAPGPGGGLVLTGNVGRPGTYNCDRPVIPVCYTGIVTDCAGTPMPGVEIRLTGGSVTSSTTTRTARDGTYTVTGAARVGAIIEGRAMAGGNTYIEQTDFVNGSTDSCTSAPRLSFPFRYVGGVVRANQSDTRTFDGVRDSVSSLSGAAAQFWDFERGPVPYVLTCDVNPRDSLGPNPTGPATSAPSLEVGSPVRLTNGATITDLFRQRRAGTLVAYGTMFGTTLPEAMRFDVEIRGAAGTIPFTSLPGALHMPSGFAITSPPSDSARSFTAASGIPLAWDTVPGEEAEISVLVFSRSDSSLAAYAELTDDGSETLSLSGFPTLRGLVSINMTRTVRRYERLETGPSVMLVGTRAVTFDAEIR
ncbi:MAG: carboxypeptidase regulatory-like domain-containing protein [Sandaracinaceae bacterium]|nr:carboxypeptidase regulatory-like domain-containing protein [Sandaracinaceae bacterium]